MRYGAIHLKQRSEMVALSYFERIVGKTAIGCATRTDILST